MFFRPVANVATRLCQRVLPDARPSERATPVSALRNESAMLPIGQIISSMPATAVVHFLLVELRLVFVGFLSFRSIVANTLLQVVLEVTPEARWCDISAKHTTVNDMYSKLTQEINSVMLNPKPLVHSEVSPHVYHMVGPIFYSGLFLAILLVSTALTLLARSGATDFRSGKYLAFTWNLANATAFRAVLNICYAFGVVCTTGLLAVGVINDIIPKVYLPSTFPYVTLNIALRNLPSILVLLLSGYGLQITHPPGFAWRSKAFADHVFDGRPWLDLFTTSNELFGSKVSAALLKCNRGRGNNESFQEPLLKSEAVEKLRLLASQEEDEVSA